MEPVLANSYAQMKGLLERGRVDLLLVSDIEGLSPANNSEWRDLVILSEPVTRFSLFHYINRRHVALAVPLANALKELDRNGVKHGWLKKSEPGRNSSNGRPMTCRITKDFDLKLV